jgi:hypothetical protein
MQEQIRLELSGNCEADLAGKEIWFRVRKLGEADFEVESVSRFQHRQIGVAGKITAAFRTPFGADGQPLDADKARDDADWRPCLHIEWFGQHGRTLVEVRDVLTQEATGDVEDQDAFYIALFDEEELEPPPEPEPVEVMMQMPDELENDDPFGIDFPFEQEFALFDDIIENPGERLPLREALAEEIDFAPPDELDENRACYLLRLILARLAVSSIAYDMCEHVGAVDAYRMLYEQTVDTRDLAELSGTGFVKHFSSYDDCPECEAEFERDWQDFDAKQQSPKDGATGSDQDKERL